MDAIDWALIEGWSRAWAAAVARYGGSEILARAHFRRRVRRRWGLGRRTGVMLGVPRAWCLGLRAGDRRIGDYAVTDSLRDARARECHSRLYEAAEVNGGPMPHEVTLDHGALGALCRPVRIEWPGVSLLEASALLGRNEATVCRWLRDSRKVTTFSPLARWEGGVPLWEAFDAGPFRVVYEKSQCHGYFGKPRPVVWTPSAVDPSSMVGRRPPEAWGSLWLWLWERLSDRAILRATRVPQFQRCNDGSTRFRRWHWVCPGRRDEDGQWMDCGRRSSVLFCPMRCDEGFWERVGWGTAGGTANAGASAHAGGTADAIGGFMGPRMSCAVPVEGSFACRLCWDVRFGSDGSTHSDWGEFVSYVTGGLLYGHEVERVGC